MTAYQPGDRVQVDIPNPDDPDHRYHDEVGTVSAVYVDDLGTLTGNPEDDYLYTVVFDDEDLSKKDFRHTDLTTV